MKNGICTDILNLIQEFLENRIDAVTFEDKFLERRREKMQIRAEWDNELLAEGADRIFSAVDRFYPGEERDEIDLDERQLYAEVQHWATHMGLPAVRR